MDDHTLIQQYLHGELNEASLDRLKERLATDKDFAEQLQIESVFYANRNKNLKDKLRVVSKKEQETPVKSLPIRWKRILSMAASVALIVSAVWIYQSNTSNSNFSDLVEQYTFEKPDAPITTMGNTIVSDLWNQAIQAYQNSDYKNAANLITEINEPTAEQQFYSAICLFRADPPQTQNALEIFRKIIDQKDALFRDQAMWYGALSHIELDQKNEATNLLKEIIKTKSWRHEDAQALVNAFNKK